ncbi:hypothetical protein GE061_008941 [Apolygus lucorum]|uniref:RB1-inducible coiled-coil protein 1 n=1 Tax=Apolygus lucorum TaxID=248454 RepID=A0A6A4JRW5_APOLU|nr:hypothetical protein GE061_008941 [Apolygus lucorum]
MLFVFHVDTGTMITFDINLALESVGTLKEEVERACGIAVDKQVLLISGGECLDGYSRVCSYSAGTDTNPIFLFSKSTIESTTPPSPSIDHGSDLELKDEVDQALNLPPSISTVMARSQLAQQMCELAKQQTAACDKLVHDQHMQQQGWAAVIANLDDITSAFRNRSENIQTTFKQHVDLRNQFHAILESFTNDVDILSKIPVLPALLDKEESENAPANLFKWIAAKDNQASVDQLADTCKKGLEQFSDGLLDSIKAEVTSVLEAASKSELREIKGLEERLYGLEQLKCDTKKIVQEQTDLAQAFLQNQSRASNLGDASILPDLCTSHKRQLVVMLRNHQQLRDIRKRCVRAKQELSTNLYHRLKWVMFVESRILEVDSKLVMYHESIKRLQRQLEVISQIHSAPNVYLSAVAEVVRRRTFSQAFLIWANNVASQLCAVHSEEVARRKVFQSQFEGHFLSSLFRGLEDSPPPFATQAPPLFDSELPKLTLDDIEKLRRDLPDLALSISVPDLSQITQFFLNRSITNLKSDMGHPPAASIEERIVEAVSAAGLSSNLDPALLQPADGSQSMSANTTHPISSDRGFESETDTEEFEKVGQSPSEITKDETELRSNLQSQFNKINCAVEQVVHELRCDMGNLRQWVLCERTELEFLLSKLSSVWNEANERLSQEYELRQAAERREVDLENRIKAIVEENEKLRSRVEELETEVAAERVTVQEVTTRHKEEIEAITSRYKLYSQSIDRSCHVHEKMEGCEMIERSEHNTVVNRIREEMMAQHMVALEDERAKFNCEIEKVKLRADAERQVLFNETVRRIVVDKDRQLEEMRAREAELNLELTKQKDIVVQLDTTIRESNPDSLQQRILELEMEKSRYLAELQILKGATGTTPPRSVSPSSSVVILNEVASSSSSGSRDVATSPEPSPRKSRSVKDKLTSSTNTLIKSRKVTIDSCNPGENVLVAWDFDLSAYTIVQESSTLFVLHCESLKLLGLNETSPKRTLYTVGEVVDKEYCRARKRDNRYHVPEGSKFYRVKVKSLPS